jgi:hypothetical protein
MSEISMQQLKEQRLTPAERFVLDKIKGVKPDEPSKNGDIRWCDEDGRCFFRQEFRNNTLWISYGYLGYFLEGDYNLNYEETKQILFKLLYKYTNNGQLKMSGRARGMPAVI